MVVWQGAGGGDAPVGFSRAGIQLVGGALGKPGAFRVGGGIVGLCGELRRMGAERRDRAWAERMVVRAGGRPDRMLVWCLVQGVESPGSWGEFPRVEQERALLPFVRDGERMVAANDGEVFIVPEATGGRGQSEASGKALVVLQEEAAARRAFARAEGSLLREEFQKGYAAATVHMAGEYVRLEQDILAKALAEDASDAERRLAFAAYRDWKDRNMGKPVAAVEDVTAKQTDVRLLMASSRPVLPASSTWSVESVAEDARRELEAGSIEGEAE